MNLEKHKHFKNEIRLIFIQIHLLWMIQVHNIVEYITLVSIWSQAVIAYQFWRLTYVHDWFNKTVQFSVGGMQHKAKFKSSLMDWLN